MSINRVFLIGRVSDFGPKLTYNANGKPECSVTLMLEEPGKDGYVFKTFVAVQVVGPRAEEAAETLEPGDLCLVEGKLSYKAGQMKDAGKVIVLTFDVQRLVTADVTASAHEHLVFN